MNRTAWAALIAALIPGVTGAQMGMGGMGGNGMGMMGNGMGMMGGSPVRRQFVMRYGVEPKYEALSNPLPPSPANVEAGKHLYEQDCAACHGAQGYGDGPAAKTLDPPPADLHGIGRMPMMSDGYLYWTIAEGGVPVKSAMPPFKATLSRDDIWKIILYIRAI